MTFIAVSDGQAGQTDTGPGDRGGVPRAGDAHAPAREPIITMPRGITRGDVPIRAVWSAGPGTPRDAWAVLVAHGRPKVGGGLPGFLGGFLGWILTAVPKIATFAITTACSYSIALAQIPGGLAVLAFIGAVAWLTTGGLW